MSQGSGDESEKQPAERLTGPMAPEPPAPQGSFVLTTGSAHEVGPLSPVPDSQAEARLAEQRGMADFHAGLMTATPKVIVTPTLVVACVAVFVAMALRGVSATQPGIEELLAWGANFGPYVAVDGEYWRLLTSMFLHIGFVHLAFNMWCLLSAGPMIERLFGNLAFAAVYLLSGLGGQLASQTFHPLIVSAGASGAIFGIFGALVGFLLIQHQSIPAAMIRPLRASATSFIAYNIFFGMMSQQIDNAAHIGGLATGFICGLLLSRRLPITAGSRGIGRRLVAAAGLAAALFLAARASVEHLASDPLVRSDGRENQRFATAFNDLMNVLEKPTRNYEALRGELNSLLDRLERTGRPSFGDQALVIRFLGELDADLSAMRRAEVPDPELRKVLDAFITCESNLRDAIAGLHPVVGHDLTAEIPEPDLFAAKMNASNRAANEFVALRDRFVKEHGLVMEAPPPASGGPGKAPRNPGRRPPP
jgi:rhomboid protease GluP